MAASDAAHPVNRSASGQLADDSVVQRVGVEPTWYSFTDCCMAVLPPLGTIGRLYYTEMHARIEGQKC